MDTVEWCDKVLKALVSVADNTLQGREIGIDRDTLAYAISPESPCPNEVYDALLFFRDEGFVTDHSGLLWRPTHNGRDHAEDASATWERICQIRVRPEYAEVIRVVNSLSTYDGDTFAGVNEVDGQDVLKLLGLQDDDRLFQMAQELNDDRFLGLRAYLGNQMTFWSTYRGLVWDTRQAFTAQSRFIDELVREWETTSVDFKRELRTGTKDEKAEFVKDVVGLVNTQASGRRWMIIGFDDKTRSYHGPPDATLSQNHLEQIVAQYVTPVVDIRYEVVSYRSGRVGMLEVIRSASKLPYSVSTAVGDRKRIQQGDVFVRHGSQTELPTSGELQAIQDEGDRARVQAS